jgi:hypothetical protein
MPTLELDEKESGVLEELLESAVSELGYEIANTDSADYRNGLKEKRAAASAILKRVQGGAG